MADEEDFFAGPTVRQQLEKERKAREAEYARIWRRNLVAVIVVVVFLAGIWWITR